MPVLASPEVQVTICNGGLVCFEQKVDPALSNDSQTDVGINGTTGMNVICHRIELHKPCPQNQTESSLHMTVVLCEAWAQERDFCQTLRTQHGVDIQERTIPYSDKMMMISVRGIPNIEKLTGALRSSFVETEHKGATISRQIANAALLNTVLDAAHEMVVADRQKRKIVDGRKSYISADWSNFNI